MPALSGAEVELYATRPRALGTSAPMARVEWSEAELNATLGELSGGNSAARGFEADAPPLGRCDRPEHGGRNRVEAPRAGVGASPARIRREPVARNAIAER